MIDREKVARAILAERYGRLSEADDILENILGSVALGEIAEAARKEADAAIAAVLDQLGPA